MPETEPGSAAQGEPANPQTTPSSDVAAIAASLQSEEPTPQPHAIAQAQADAKAAEGKDKHGEAFNPAIHATNADGSPRKTVTGRFALKRGKKSGTADVAAPATSGAKLKTPAGIATAAQNQQSAAKVAAARAGGKGAANLMFMLSTTIGGEEWIPVVDPKTGRNEPLMMETAFGDFFVAMEWEDLPPGWALVAAISVYSLPRLRMPQTRTRLQRFRGWVGSTIGRWKANRSAKKRGIPESDAERIDRESREAARRMPPAMGATSNG